MVSDLLTFSTPDLSPQEYKGIDFRVSRELIRMTKLFDGNVSVQNLLSGKHQL